MKHPAALEKATKTFRDTFDIVVKSCCEPPKTATGKLDTHSLLAKLAIMTSHVALAEILEELSQCLKNGGVDGKNGGVDGAAKSLTDFVNAGDPNLLALIHLIKMGQAGLSYETTRRMAEGEDVVVPSKTDSDWFEQYLKKHAR